MNRDRFMSHTVAGGGTFTGESPSGAAIVHLHRRAPKTNPNGRNTGRSRPIALPTRHVVDASRSAPLARLFEDLGSISELVGETGFPEAVAKLIQNWLPVDSIALFEFKDGIPPCMLFATGGQSDGDMIEYSSGIYLLDPMYNRFARDRFFGTMVLGLGGNDEQEMPDPRYWDKRSGSHEIGTLMEVSPDRCAHLSIFATLGEHLTQALAFIELLHPMLTPLFRRHLLARADLDLEAEEARRKVHESVSAIMAGFGEDVLTGREREIAQLLLKGHSSKSIARVLGISPGTAAIHRSNVYKKLGTSGQCEMFSIFVNKLVSG